MPAGRVVGRSPPRGYRGNGHVQPGLGTVGRVAGRIGLTDITPTVACGRYPAKAVVGQSITVGATVFREGHDAVAANVVFRPPAEKAGSKRASRAGGSGPLLRMRAGIPGTDRWSAQVVPDRQGMWTLIVEAWSDPLETWRHAVEVKAAAGQSGDEMANDLESGARLLDRIARRPQQRYAGAIRAAVEALRDPERSVVERIGPALAGELWSVLTADPIRELVTRSAPVQVWVDRKLAEFGSWYEFFPRSIGAQIRSGRPGDAARHAARRRSPSCRGSRPMNFDIVYLPPIHPIGEQNRKGRNNSVTCEPGRRRARRGPSVPGSAATTPCTRNSAPSTTSTPSSPATKDLGLEVALDLALQCAPDHPWVTEHPEWFTTRPDGSIAYAENPPKKYQDIYPINFDNDPAGLYAEVLRVVQFWIDHGVTVFRVDNPHTKPINFWEWLIGKVHQSTPDAIFLAEAFTKPAMMHELARVGFSQSYTYFTWRTDKQELIDYGVELVEASDYMRPNFFVNTPDILHASLQYGGPSMFAVRAVLAATLSPTWGVYSGFELFEHERGPAGQRGVPGLGEVPAASAGLRHPARAWPLAGAADHPAEPDPPPAPGPAADEGPVVPLHLERAAALLLPAGPADPRHRHS